MSQGHGMRIDNGNSFDFRAQGEKKDPDRFKDVVEEVEAASSGGFGIRQNYPGLEDETIRAQVRTLKVKLSDEKIDELVDSIRRPKLERDELASILKARKRYLVDKFL